MAWRSVLGVAGGRAMGMLREIEPAGDLRSARAAVGAILCRAAELGLYPGSAPWSTAELRLDEDDYAWLLDWGRRLEPSLFGADVLRWLPLDGARARGVTVGAAIGLLLILVASELARREATEGTLWRHVRSDDAGRRRFGAADAVLFVQGAPSVGFKSLIDEAARGFGLRHALDEEDVQKYYRTIFLQIGFTIRDARKRLARWLAGGVSPVACRQLLDLEGGGRGGSFRFLWETLRGFRHNNIGAESALRRLGETPWALSGWAEELLNLAREPIAGWEDVHDDDRGGVPFLSQPRLRRAGSARPSLVVRVENLAGAGLTEPEYDLRLAGEVRARIFRVGEDQFEVEPGVELEFPLGSPTVTAELIDGGGRVARAEPVSCWDPGEPVAIFHGPTGARLEAGSGPKSNGEYFLLAAEDLELEPEAAHWSLVPTPLGRLKLWSLAGADVPRAALRDAKGREIWRADGPAPASGAGAPSWARTVFAELAASGRADDLPSRPVPVVIRHPPDVRVIFARLGQRPLECAGERPGRTIAGPIAIPPEALTHPDQARGGRSLELLVGLLHRGEAVRIALGISVAGGGAARLRGDGWSPLGPEVELDRAEAETELFRVIPPARWDGRDIPFGEWAVMEGNAWIDRPRASPRRLSGLSGLGAPLTARRGPYNSTGDAMRLAAAVVDRGAIREVEIEPATGDRIEVRIALSRPIEIDARCRVATWRRDGSLVWAEPTPPLREGEEPGTRWVATLLADEAPPRAVAIAYDGERLGAWWAEDWARELERRIGPDRAGDAAAAMRWLRLPLLSRDAAPRVRSFARAFPVAVLGAWILDADPPSSARWPRPDEGFRPAARAIFRDWAPDPAAFPDLMNQASAGLEGFREAGLALALFDLSPMLAARVLRAWLFDGGARDADPASARALLGLLRHEIHARVMVALRAGGKSPRPEEARANCAKLLGGVDEGFLQSLFEAAAEHVHSQSALGAVSADNLDVAAGEVPLFRDILALELLQGFDRPPERPPRIRRGGGIPRMIGSPRR